MRLLHTMLRVGDLQRSIDFYTNVLGMKPAHQRNPEYKYSLAFVGYGEEERNRGNRTDLQLGRGQL